MRIIALDSSACHWPTKQQRAEQERPRRCRPHCFFVGDGTGDTAWAGGRGEASRAHDASGEGPPREHLVLWQAQARQHLAHGEEDLGNHSKEELVS